MRILVCDKIGRNSKRKFDQTVDLLELGLLFGKLGGLNWKKIHEPNPIDDYRQMRDWIEKKICHKRQVVAEYSRGN